MKVKHEIVNLSYITVVLAMLLATALGIALGMLLAQAKKEAQSKIEDMRVVEGELGPRPEVWRPHSS